MSPSKHHFLCTICPLGHSNCALPSLQFACWLVSPSPLHGVSALQQDFLTSSLATGALTTCPFSSRTTHQFFPPKKKKKKGIPLKLPFLLQVCFLLKSSFVLKNSWAFFLTLPMNSVPLQRAEVLHSQPDVTTWWALQQGHQDHKERPWSLNSASQYKENTAQAWKETNEFR